MAVSDTKHAASETGSRLESLPPEVRRCLLSTLHLPQLKALVRASPTFHSQYRHSRGYLLRRSLDNTLGSVIVDAYAVHLSGPGIRLQEGGPLFDSYSTNIQQRCLPRTFELGLGEAINMASFYIKTVHPIVECYAQWTWDMLASMAGKKKVGDHQQRVELTHTEAMRFTRAIYRFELLCEPPDPIDPAIGYRFRPFVHGPIKALLNLLEPWENEELLSFYQFMEDVYGEVFDGIHWDLHPDTLRFDQAFRPDCWEHRDGHIQGTALRGLSLFRKVLFECPTRQRLISAMQHHMISDSHVLNTRPDGSFGERGQALRRTQEPSERDRMEKERNPFPFPGDGEPDAPPMAWTMIWSGTYSNSYGWCIPDALRRCGYIFWDAGTLEAAGGREVVEQQWETMWVRYDPRGFAEWWN